MRFLYATFFSLLIAHDICGQVFRWEDHSNQVVNMNSIHISGDYGRRECCNNSKWHDGLDVSGSPGDTDIGFRIFSIEGGQIRRIEGDGNYHWIGISGNNNFGYGHIFPWNSNSSGGFRLYRWTARMTWVIIDIEENRAFTNLIPPSPLPQNDPNNQYTFTYSEGGTQYTFSFLEGSLPLLNTIQQGMPIAPIGDSGGNGTADPFAAHVHLYRFNTLLATGTASQARRWNNLSEINPFFQVRYEDVHCLPVHGYLT